MAAAVWDAYGLSQTAAWRRGLGEMARGKWKSTMEVLRVGHPGCQWRFFRIVESTKYKYGGGL